MAQGLLPSELQLLPQMNVSDINAVITKTDGGFSPADVVRHIASQDELEAIPNKPRRDSTSLLEPHCYRVGELIRNFNFDWWTIHHGAERSGKSTEAQENIFFKDPTFIDVWEERIAYDGPTFFDIVIASPKGSSVLFDEAGSEWLRAEWYEQVNINLGKALKVCGYKNLDVHIVTPNWRDLPPNVLRRANDWCFVGLGKSYERGFLELWGKSESKFRKGAMPYLFPRFYERFPPLPWYYERDYIKFKIENTETLLTKYGQAIAHEADEGMTFSEFVKDIISKVEDDAKKAGSFDRFRNSRGAFDMNRIRVFIDAPEQVARAAAGELTYKHSVKRKASR